MKSKEIYIHFLWHQHQPWYPAPGSGMCSMPWTRLHGVKDYYDMAELCSRFDGWTQTINLVPSLIEQILGYVDGTITDRYFELSQKPAAELNTEEKKEIIKDRQANKIDRREGIADRHENRRDRREDVRDDMYEGGALDKVEDVYDRREDVYDRRENRRDRATRPSDRFNN